MIELNTIQRIYFIGIGGIGMSALARYFNSLGKVVCGYDKTETRLSTQLAAEGIAIHYTDDIALLDKAADLVVYTPAIPAQHQQLNWYLQNGYPVLKRSDVLQMITSEAFSICVAGTHGKTSISTMIAHLLTHSGYGCNAFLGGISVNYNTNFWSSANNVCVVEADEYDRSFLKLNPDIAVITSMDADHLDIYGTAEAVEDAFVEFAGKIKPGGLLVRKQGLKRLDSLMIKKQIIYSLNAPPETLNSDGHDHEHDHDATAPDVYAQNIRMQSGGYLFDVHINNRIIENVAFNIGGLHNIENLLSSITVAKALNIGDEKIKAAVGDFKGVKRRFEYILRHLPESKAERGLVYIDDYAHHPAELRALISGARGLYPGWHCTIVFQPHLYTRTRDFAAEFAEALDLADQVLLLPIYPARELPIEGVSAQMIADLLPVQKVSMVTMDELPGFMNQPGLELVITAGAGDIDTTVPVIGRILKTRLNK